jgi:hypothetical protein
MSSSPPSSTHIRLGMNCSRRTAPKADTHSAGTFPATWSSSASVALEAVVTVHRHPAASARTLPAGPTLLADLALR